MRATDLWRRALTRVVHGRAGCASRKRTLTLVMRPGHSNPTEPSGPVRSGCNVHAAPWPRQTHSSRGASDAAVSISRQGRIQHSEARYAKRGTNGTTAASTPSDSTAKPPQGHGPAFSSSSREDNRMSALRVRSRIKPTLPLSGHCSRCASWVREMSTLQTPCSYRCKDVCHPPTWIHDLCCSVTPRRSPSFRISS